MIARINLSRIRFPAEWRDDSARQHIRMTDFKLGLGPCGKVVTALSLEIGEMERVALIGQQTEDGEIKEFIYPLDSILGRIEITRN